MVKATAVGTGDAQAVTIGVMVQRRQILDEGLPHVLANAEAQVNHVLQGAIRLWKDAPQTAGVVWRKSEHPPISQFMRWLHKATLCAYIPGHDETGTFSWTPQEQDRLFDLWMENYDEDAAAQTVLAERR